MYSPHLGYLQFSAVAEDVLPEEYETFLSYLSFVNFDIGVIVSYSCLFSPNFYGRLILISITPLVLLIILYVAYDIAKQKYLSSPQYIHAVRSRYLSAALFVPFFVYSSVSSAIFHTFPCEDLGGDVTLKADHSIPCAGNRYTAYRIYAGVMVVVYPIGIPAFFCWWLVRNRNYLKVSGRHTIAHLQPFNGVWGTYRPSRYYFEVVEYGRRLTLSMTSVLLVPDSVDHIAVVLSVAAVFLFVSESLSPFQRSVDMSLYRWGNGVVLASMYVALLKKAKAYDTDFKVLSAFGWVLITANVVMIVVVAVEAVLLGSNGQGFRPRVERVVSRVRCRNSVRLEGRTSVHPAPMLDYWSGEAKDWGLSGQTEVYQ